MANDPRPTYPIAAASIAPAREMSLQDVRDLALAVIEGAVAAESLAKELKKAPDRSRHFQDIAERLRAVVGRHSIRCALTDSPNAPPGRAQGDAESSLATPPGSPAVILATPPGSPSVILATPPELRTAGPALLATTGETAPAKGVPESVPESVRTVEAHSGEHDIAAWSERAAQLDRIESLVRETLANDHQPPPGLAELEGRLARLEEALGRTLSRREEGERYALRTPEEAIALAARLTERLRRDTRVVVRIEP